MSPWRYTSSTIIARAAAPAVICGGYVYFLGGELIFPADPYSTVERARILNDGTLGTWVLESDTLPIPVFGAAAISRNGYIYVIGGAAHVYQHTNAVQYTLANPDGTLQTWQLTSPVLQGRHLPAFAEYQGYVYIMGGSLSSGERVNSVEYAKINPDGTLGNWSYTNSMQTVRWQPSAHAYNGYIYVLGGLDWGGTLATVEYAKINLDGSLGPWNYTSSMAVPRDGWPGTAVLNGYLYAFGGDHPGLVKYPVNSAEKTFINPDGSLGPWSLEPDTLLNSVAHAGCAQNNGHVYTVGGVYYSYANARDDVQMTGVYYLIGGDANCDGVVDVGDIVYLINYLFKGGPPPGCP